MKVSRIVAVLAATAALMALVAPAAHADATNVTITGGSLGITTAPLAADFTSVTLDGTAKTTTAAMDAFEVNDARGTGAGWKVTVGGTQFCEWDATLGACVVGGKTLGLNSLKLSQPTVAQDGTTSTSPTITTGPYTIDSVADGTGTVKVASAAADTGMGKYDFSATTLTVSIPASAYAKTYRSTVTVTVASGP